MLLIQFIVTAEFLDYWLNSIHTHTHKKETADRGSSNKTLNQEEVDEPWLSPPVAKLRSELLDHLSKRLDGRRVVHDLLERDLGRRDTDDIPVIELVAFAKQITLVFFGRSHLSYGPVRRNEDPGQIDLLDQETRNAVRPRPAHRQSLAHDEERLERVASIAGLIGVALAQAFWAVRILP